MTPREQRAAAADRAVEIAIAQLDPALDQRMRQIVLDHAKTTIEWADHVDLGSPLRVARILEATRHTDAGIVLDRNRTAPEKAEAAGAGTLTAADLAALSQMRLSERINWARRRGIA